MTKRPRKPNAPLLVDEHLPLKGGRIRKRDADPDDLLSSAYIKGELLILVLSEIGQQLFKFQVR